MLDVELKERVRALRAALKMTQEQLADASGLDRVEVSNLEVGRNQATSTRILKGLARGFGLDLQAMSDFVDGALSVEEAVQLRGAGGAGPQSSDPYPARVHAAKLADEDGVQEAAIRAVLGEQVRPEDAGRSVLWWARRMKMKELELETRAESAEQEKAAGNGRRSKKL